MAKVIDIRDRNRSYYGPKGYYILWEKCFMNKESIKKFVKENKTVIIGGALTIVGAAALAIVGVKLSKENSLKNAIVGDDELMNFIKTIDEASDGCKQYVMLTLPEIAATIDKDGIVRDCVRDPDGKLFEIKNVIAFGNNMEG